MRDHDVGAFGAVALVVVCVVDSVTRRPWIERGRGARRSRRWGRRTGRDPAAGAPPPVRATREGTGSRARRNRPATVVVGLGTSRRARAPRGDHDLAGLGAATVVTTLGLYWHRWLGGVTGDLLGATAKLAETATLVTALAVL